MKFDRELRTAGTGYWSKRRAIIKVLNLDVPYTNEEHTFGELLVFFDAATWDVYTDGLIYTDDLFLLDLKSTLLQEGLAGDDVNYSEQGMQGDAFVSLDVGEEFLKSWDAKSNK